MASKFLSRLSTSSCNLLRASNHNGNIYLINHFHLQTQSIHNTIDNNNNNQDNQVSQLQAKSQLQLPTHPTTTTTTQNSINNSNNSINSKITRNKKTSIFSHNPSNRVYTHKQQQQCIVSNYNKIQKRFQTTTTADGTPAEQVNMLTALNDALRITLTKDDTAVIFGEDVGFGGVFRVTQNLRDEFGSDRVFNSPLSEQGIVGFGIGLAAVGHTAIAEIQFADYIMPAWDQIVNEAAKFRYRSASDWDCGKLTIRTAANAVGHGGLYHSQSPESYFAHCPGLKLVYPRGPYTAKGLLRASINDANPVIFFEPKRMYAFPRELVPIEDYEIELGHAEVIREGKDVTMVGWGALLTQMADACDYIYERDGISVELIDLQTVLPFDEETLIKSVKKTGKMVICHEATFTAGFGAEIAATIQEACFLYLEAPIQRCTGHDTPNALIFEPFFMPNKFRMYEAVKKVIDY